MIKVCHFTSVHPATDGRIFKKECCSLAKAGYEVYLVAPNATSEMKNGVHIIGLPIKGRGRVYRMLCTTKQIYKQAVNVDADIYHFHDPELLPYGLKLCKRGKYVIYDVHEDYRKKMTSKRYIPWGMGKIMNFFIGHYEDFCVKRYSGIITATDYISKRFKPLNENVFTIKNYPLINYPLIERKRLENNICVFAGTLSENLCIYEMVTALALTKNRTQLYLAGKWSSEVYRKKVMTSSGWKYVCFLGYITVDEVKNIMMLSSVGIVLQRDNLVMRQAISTKLFEYMLCALPIVSSCLPLHVQINQKYETQILINPLDIQEVANAIDYLLDNKEKALKLGYNGQNAVLKEYNWEKQEEELIKVYNNILNY